LVKYYKDKILKLSLNKNGELIANDNKIVSSRMNGMSKNKYNYILNCDEELNS